MNLHNYRAVTGIVASLLLVSCSGSSDQKLLTEACVDSGQIRSVCRCAAKKMKKNLSKDDYAFLVEETRIAKKHEEEGQTEVEKLARGVDMIMSESERFMRIASINDAALRACQN